MKYGQITVTNSPTLIIAGNESRKEVIFSNDSSSVKIYIGMDNLVTTSNGLPFHQNETRGHARGFGTYLGPIYGVTATGSADVRYWETT